MTRCAAWRLRFRMWKKALRMEHCLEVKGKLFVRWRNEEDPDTIVLKMPFDHREELMAADPETYFITDHYRNYPWVLVRLSKVHPDALHELLHIAYSNALPAKRRPKASLR
jgi:hypothetical protein